MAIKMGGLSPGPGYDPKATEHLETLNQTLTQFSKDQAELLDRQSELLTKQTEVATQQAADIQELIEVSTKTANSTDELAKSTAGNEKKSNIALGTAVISALLALATLTVDYLGDAQWQEAQIHKLETQTELLESISKQLGTLESSDPITSKDIQDINNKLDQLIQLSDSK